MTESRIKNDGAICDRCNASLSTRAIYQAEGYEYVCVDCMTPAESAAFGIEVQCG